MGRKVHPIGFRLGISRKWDASWYANPKAYVNALHEDLKLRAELKTALRKRAAKVTAMPTAIIDFLSQKKFEFDSKMYTIMTTKGIFPKS